MVMDGRMNGWMDRVVDQWEDGWVDGWLDELVDKWMDGKSGEVDK